MYIGINGLSLPQLVEKVWALSFNWWTTWVDKASSKGEISSFLKEKKKKKPNNWFVYNWTAPIRLLLHVANLESTWPRKSLPELISVTRYSFYRAIPSRAARGSNFLGITGLPRAKFFPRNSHGYFKRYKRITHDYSRTESHCLSRRHPRQSCSSDSVIWSGNHVLYSSCLWASYWGVTLNSGGKKNVIFIEEKQLNQTASLQAFN